MRHRRKVFCACRGFFSDSSAAKDATQEAFLRAYRSICVYKGGNFVGWLMQIARNVCIDEWRKNRRQTSLEHLDSAEKTASVRFDSSFEMHWVADRVREEIRMLPREQRSRMDRLGVRSLGADGTLEFQGTVPLPVTQWGATVLDRNTGVSGTVTVGQGKMTVRILQFRIGGASYRLTGSAGQAAVQPPGRSWRRG